MDTPYIKLLLLIVPAIMTAVVLVLAPLYEAKKSKMKLLGKTITVLVYLQDDAGNEMELYRTSGTIESIHEKVMQVKRSTQPSFRIPYLPHHLSQNSEVAPQSDYVSTHFVDSEKELDRNKGLFNT